MKFHKLLLIFYLLLVTSIVYANQPPIYGEWKIKDMIINGQHQKDLGLNLRIVFLPDGRVYLHFEEKVEFGQWRIEAGKLILITDNKKREAFNYHFQGNQLIITKDSESIVLER